MRVIKKILRVFKSKFILVPLVGVGLLATGAGVAALTTKDQTEVATNPNQYINDTSYFKKRGSSLMSNTLGESTTTPETSSPSPSVTKPTPKPKKIATASVKTVSCNTQQKAVYTSQYNSAITAENSLYATNQTSPDYTNDPSTEDSRHLSALNTINQTYQQQLASIHCA